MNKTVFTAYLTKKADPQRKIRWANSIKDCQPLMLSLQGFNQHFTLFHDGVNLLRYDNSPSMKFVQVGTSRFVPNVYRWMCYRHHLMNNQNIEWVWCVDSTDVLMLREPWEEMEKGVLYVGCEHKETLRNKWLETVQRPYFKAPDYEEVLAPYRDHMLLNCGLIGGHRDIMLEYISKVVEYHGLNSYSSSHSTDMICANYTIFKHFADRISFGDHVNTVFKAFERGNTKAWWKHK